MIIGTQFSPCQRYRYTLERQFSMVDPHRARWCTFLMLNPSTADQVENDNTINRCIDYAKRWGYDGLLVGNLYAYRSTDPRALLLAADPVGEENDEWLVNMAALSEIVVCAWGVNAHPDRALRVTEMLHEMGTDLRYLIKTKAGVPGHPLYLKKELLPQPWGNS